MTLQENKSANDRQTRACYRPTGSDQGLLQTDMEGEWNQRRTGRKKEEDMKDRKKGKEVKTTKRERKKERKKEREKEK